MPPTGSAPIFRNHKGIPPTFQSEIQTKPAAAAAQIGTEIGWHTFRRTYSSMLRQLGVDVKVQQELLRHADAGTKLNLYTQVVSDRSVWRSPVWCGSCSLWRNLVKTKRLDISGQRRKANISALSSLMVGAIGFEPTTPCAQGRCATRLRYAPTVANVEIINEESCVSRAIRAISPTPSIPRPFLLLTGTRPKGAV